MSEVANIRPRLGPCHVIEGQLNRRNHPVLALAAQGSQDGSRTAVYMSWTLLVLFLFYCSIRLAMLHHHYTLARHMTLARMERADNTAAVEPSNSNPDDMTPFLQASILNPHLFRPALLIRRCYSHMSRK